MITQLELKNILNKYGFTETQINILINNKTILAKGKLQNIDDILKLLLDYGISKEKIVKCKTVLALGKAKEIEKIFEILEKNKISKETIENCLSVLALGKAEEIEKIFKVLEKNKISKETIEKCLYVLARGKAEEIEKIFEILENNGVKKEIIEDNFSSIFLKKEKQISMIFSNNPDSDIELYMKLKGIYNRVIRIEEIQEICDHKKITIKQFVEKVCREKISPMNTLKVKNGIYIGKPFPIDKENLNKYANIILDISQNVSKSLSYRYRFNKEELKDFCLMYIIEKCGDIVYDLNYDINLMQSCIYNKAKKSAIGYIINERVNIDLEKLENTKLVSKEDEKEVGELDLRQWNLLDSQNDILYTISNYNDNIILFKNVLNRTNMQKNYQNIK